MTPAGGGGRGRARQGCCGGTGTPGRGAQQAKAAREKEAAAAREKAAAERAIEATRVAEEQRRLEEERVAKDKAETERLAPSSGHEERAVAEQAAKTESEQRVMEAAREEEGRRLSEKLRKAREERELKSLDKGFSALGNPPTASDSARAEPPAAAAVAPEPPPPAKIKVTRAHAPDVQHEDAVAPDETRATILLVMEPGTRGIRRYEKTADPVLCLGQSCYISNGVDRPATATTRGRAFGPGNTLGQRAGACRHSLGCVFRNVDVGHGEIDLQPVDLRILRHDRREVQMVNVDATCAAVAGRLKCSRGVQSRTYRVWIVPESIARRAGDAALLGAVGAGLPDLRSAELDAN